MRHAPAPWLALDGGSADYNRSAEQILPPGEWFAGCVRSAKLRRRPPTPSPGPEPARPHVPRFLPSAALDVARALAAIALFTFWPLLNFANRNRERLDGFGADFLTGLAAIVFGAAAATFLLGCLATGFKRVPALALAVVAALTLFFNPRESGGRAGEGRRRSRRSRVADSLPGDLRSSRQVRKPRAPSSACC